MSTMQSAKRYLSHIIYGISLLCFSLYGIELEQGIVVDADHPKAAGMNFSILLPEKWNIIDSGRPKILKEAHTRQWQFFISVFDLTDVYDDSDLKDKSKRALDKMDDEKILEYMGSQDFLNALSNSQVGRSSHGVNIKAVQLSKVETLRIDSLPALVAQATYTLSKNNSSGPVSMYVGLVYDNARFLYLNYLLQSPEQDAKNKNTTTRVLSFEEFKELAQSVVILNKQPRETNRKNAEQTEKTEGTADDSEGQAELADDANGASEEEFDGLEKLEEIKEKIQSPVGYGVMGALLIGGLIVLKARKKKN